MRPVGGRISRSDSDADQPSHAELERLRPHRARAHRGALGDAETLAAGTRGAPRTQGVVAATKKGVRPVEKAGIGGRSAFWRGAQPARLRSTSNRLKRARILRRAGVFDLDREPQGLGQALRRGVEGLK